MNPVTGDEYLQFITGREPSRRIRRAFQDLVLAVAPPGACIFDFGCGPGIDAKLYAQKGFKVVAYDVDDEMCATFSRYCEPEIAAGQVVLLRGDYRHFRETLVPMIRERFEVTLITSNFAPLSMVADLPELFASFHALARSGAQIVASVLHPYFVGDMRHRWWWKARPLLWRHGVFSITHQAGEVFRRSADHYSTQAAGYFTLRAAVDAWSRRVPRRGERASPLVLARNRFMFLLYADSGTESADSRDSRRRA
jgi:SAM-dependent methyltransferase